jgi:hydroxymethylpyrimidine pyrophosphatase-like HAD family hydrolase
VAERLGISLDHVVTFGDGENDIDLIRDAGFGIAVADANPLLLEHADWICPTADDEGVAAVIDAYLESLA